MFEDREQAGYQLAQKLESFSKIQNILVLGLARGGVAVAKIISTFLNAPLEALVVKKIGAPDNPELAVGGVAPKKTVFWNEELIQSLGINNEEKNRLKKLKEIEREEQEKVLRGGKPLEILGKTVILVDDGVATGASVVAAALFLKKEKAKKIVLATPVIAKDTLRYIKRYFDSMIYLKSADEFQAVGQFYRSFPQIEDEEVKNILL